MRSFEFRSETVRYSDSDGVLEIRRETASLVCDHAPRKALQSSPRRRRRKVTVTVIRPSPAPVGLLPSPNDRQSLSTITGKLTR